MVYEKVIGNIQKETEYVFQQLDVTSENINNIYTHSYKTKRAEPFGKVFRNMEAGKLKRTDNSSHVSLEGKGFFELEGKDGKKYYTRNLSFNRDKDYNLVSDEKYLVPPIEAKHDYAKFVIKTDGEVIGIKSSTYEKIRLGHIKVVNFPASHELKYDGKYFSPTEKSGEPKEMALGQLHQTKVRQKTQEISNVNMPYEFMHFQQINQKLKIMASILQSLSQARRQHQQVLGQIAGG